MRTRVRPRLDLEQLPVLLLPFILAAAAVVIMHAGRDTTFFYDDWNFVDQRIGWRPYVLLYPHNEHLSLLPVLVYKVLLETVGLDSYGVFRLVSVLFNLTCGALLFVYVRRRLGSWPALGFATCLVLMGVGAWDIVWPFQIGFLGSLAATLGALLALDRNDRRGDIAACVLVCVSVSSSSQGLMLLAAVLLEVLLRDDRVRRLWIPAIPLVLYAVWYLKYGGNGHLNWNQGLPAIPDRIQGGLSAGSTAATGLPDNYGPALAIGLVAAFVYSLTRAGARLPRLLMVAAMPLAFWILISIARTELGPTEPRYLYPEGLYVVLIAAEALIVFRPRGVAAIAVGVILLLGALARAPSLNTLGDQLRANAVTSKASLTAADMLRDRLDGLTLPDPGQPQLRLYRFENAIKAYGSTPAWTAEQIPGRSPGERAALDAALIRLIGPYPAPPPNPAPASCGDFPGDGRDRGTELPNGGLYVKAGAQPVEVRLRRFGDDLTEQPQVTVKANSAASVSMPEDRSDRRWFAAVRSAGSFKACQT
jgi:hypothetical protein